MSAGSPRVVRTCAAALLGGLLGSLVVACGGNGSASAPESGAKPHPPALQSIPRFTDVTAPSGLAMVITSGHVPASQLPEVKGGGLGLFDADGDGDLDVFVPNGATLDAPRHGPGCRLWENLGGLRFADRSGPAGLSWTGWGMGVAVGDVDGDGRDDVFTSAFGPDLLLRNSGGGRLDDTTSAAGLGDARWGTGCSFGDLDGDGDLDLYVAHYVAFDVFRPPPPGVFKGVAVFGGPLGLPAQPDTLYANRGDGSFEDVSAAAGLDAIPPSHGLGAVILDIDRDGRQEVFVGNDSQPDFLLDDPGDPTAPASGDTPPPAPGSWTRRLVDRGGISGLATDGDGRAQATMGIAIADVDGNGLPDVFTTNFASDTNTLHLNDDGRFFRDGTALSGLGAASRPFLGWAALFDDFDADGDEDLLVFNGHVYPQATLETMDSEARQVPLLYARDGERFVRVTDPAAGAWLGERHVDRCAATGDLDGDGDLDVVVGELNGPVRVLRNDAGPGGDAGNRWLLVSLHDGRTGIGNRHGLGSCVELSAGGRTLTRWILSGTGFLSASEQVAHFVLPRTGDGGPVTARLSVTWPDGTAQVVENVALDRRLVVERAP